MEFTEREQKAFKLCFQYLEEDRIEELDRWLAVQNLEKLNGQFNNSIGQNEACDRAHMLLETWEHYVQNHPFVLLNPEAHRLASLAHALMVESYNLIGTLEIKNANN